MSPFPTDPSEPQTAVLRFTTGLRPYGPALRALRLRAGRDCLTLAHSATGPLWKRCHTVTVAGPRSGLDVFTRMIGMHPRLGRMGITVQRFGAVGWPPTVPDQAPDPDGRRIRLDVTASVA